jgi:hypothetical protein
MSIYVVDTSVFRHILWHVYRSVVPEIWDGLEHMLLAGHVISVKEAYRELELQFAQDRACLNWLKQFKRNFHKPTSKEAVLVKDIYSVRNFQNGISQKNILTGRPVADAFLVAKASTIGGIVVTREKYKENAAKIPNLCEYLSVPYIDEEEFQLILRNQGANTNRHEVAPG